jgi:hypothetical protein
LKRLELPLWGRVSVSNSAAVLKQGKLTVFARTSTGRPYVVAEHELDAGDGFSPLGLAHDGMGLTTVESAGALNLTWRFKGKGIRIFRGGTVGDGNKFTVSRFEQAQSNPEIIAFLAFAALALKAWSALFRHRASAPSPSGGAATREATGS